MAQIYTFIKIPEGYQVFNRETKEIIKTFPKSQEAKIFIKNLHNKHYGYTIDNRLNFRCSNCGCIGHRKPTCRYSS